MLQYVRSKLRLNLKCRNDPSHNYPYGLFEFTLDLPGGLSCAIVESKAKAKDTVRIASAQSATMTLKFYDAAHNEINMEGYTYRKYGLQPVDDLKYSYQ